MANDSLNITGTVRGVFFSLGTAQPPYVDPQFDCAKAVVDLLNQTKNTAHIAIYSITEPDIVNSIIAAHNRGIDVHIVTDATESKNRSQSIMIKKLNNAGIDIRLTVRQPALMHNKVGIFDEKTICTGSFNWTSNAEKRNDENLIIVDGNEIASAYEKYVFQRILQNETLISVDNFVKS